MNGVTTHLNWILAYKEGVYVFVHSPCESAVAVFADDKVATVFDLLHRHVCANVK